MRASYFWCGMIGFMLWAGMPCVAQDVFGWLTKEKPVYGNPIPEGELKSSFLLFVFLDDGELSMNLLPELVQIQNKYKTLCIAATWSPEDVKKITTEARLKGIRFPIYQGLEHPLVQNSMHRPRGILTDKNFEVYCNDSIRPVLIRVDEEFAPKKEPLPVAGGAAGVEGGAAEQAQKPGLSYGFLNPLREEEAGIYTDIRDAFEPGKPWKAPYKKLEAASKKAGKNKKIAEELFQGITTYLDNFGYQMQHQSDSPAATLFSLQILEKSSKGIADYSKKFQEPIKAIQSSDKNTKVLAGIIAKIYKYETELLAFNRSVPAEAEDADAKDAKEAEDAEEATEDEESAKESRPSKKKGAKDDKRTKTDKSAKASKKSGKRITKEGLQREAETIHKDLQKFLNKKDLSETLEKEAELALNLMERYLGLDSGDAEDSEGTEEGKEVFRQARKAFSGIQDTEDEEEGGASKTKKTGSKSKSSKSRRGSSRSLND